MLHKYLIICILCWGHFQLKAQNSVQSIDDIINDIFEQYTAESEESIDYESFYSDLVSLVDSPLNLNNTSKEELEKLAFLNDIQIENILYYIYQHGQLNTIYELQLIDGIDMTDIKRMLQFVNIGDKVDKNKPIYFKEIWKFGNSEVYYRLDKSIEQKKGYLKTTNSDGLSTTPYFGSSVYNSLKYNFNYKNAIRFGLTMEKDPGEAFWSNAHKGYDFYSFHFQANNIGKLKNLVLGDYRASFGQGLVFNSGFGSSKSSYVLNVVSRDNGLKKFSSTDENNYFRGIGTTFNIGKTEVTGFYSTKTSDADTANNQFTSFYKTGLHRTLNELSKKNSLHQQTIGLHTNWTFKMARLGFTFAHTELDKPIKPDLSAYNLFYFSGKQQTTASLDYRARIGIFNLFGETAITNNYGIASINGALYSPTSKVSLVTLWRYYSPKYDTFYANAFSENTRINNEKGIYIGTEIRPFSKWKFSTYIDSYHFPWLKYGVGAPTWGQDYLLQAEYSPKRNLQMNWRLKYEQKAKNSSGNTIPSTYNYAKAAIRYQLLFSYGNFTSKNLIEVNYSDSAHKTAKIGFTAYQDLNYSFKKIPLTAEFRYLFFDASNYDNRFYLYEKDILYAFSIPMFYGLGSRYYFNLKYNLNNHLSIWFKFAQTIYGDGRRTIGSGNDEIVGNRKSDLRFLLRYKF